MFRRVGKGKGPQVDHMALSDTALLARVARGDAVSFETLFHRHYDRVYGLLFRLVGDRAEAEDLTQEVFLKLHDRAGDRPVGDAENVGGWLYRVAMNRGFNALRDRKRFWQHNLYLVPAAEGPDTEREVVRLEEQAAVRVALARLPERDAQLLLLRQMGFSYAELAAACGVAPGSVGTLLSRAAEAFRRAYRETGGGEDHD